MILVTVSGWQGDRFVQETYANKVYSRQIGGRIHSAIQITTASGICTVLDMLADGQLAPKGFVRQEDIPFEAFIENRFGKAYALDLRQAA